MNDLSTIMSAVVTIAVIITYINHRTIKMPSTIAIMFASLLLSLLIIIVGHLGFTGVESYLQNIVSRIDFQHLLLNSLLSLLLFAGALTIDLTELKNRRWEIGILASFSTVVSCLCIGFATYYLLQWIHLPMSLVYCFLFGALISPTDPIAVLAMFKQLNAPKLLHVSVAGESLFNDGVGIVLFLTIYQLIFGGVDISAHTIISLFLREAIGGIFYGTLLGYLCVRMIKPIHDQLVIILLTITVATGGYVIAQALDISGPLAMVVAGIVIGNYGRDKAMSKLTRENLDNFWEIIDELLNAVLFLLIGLELVVIPLSSKECLAGLIAIPLALLARYLSVGIPIWIFRRFKDYNPYTVRILTWGGLRGGLAVALALAIPDGPQRDHILTMTYFVVIFAILIQGMTIKPLIERCKS